MKNWVNGELLERKDARITVYDHGVLYGDGVFEGIRVYGSKIFQVHAHIDRLFNSAQWIRLKIPYTKPEIIEALQATLRANQRTEGYIRLVVTRGEGTLGLNPTKCPHPNVFIIADNIELYPRQMYENGMPIIIAKTIRTSATMLNPAVKSLNYLNNIMAKIECLDANVLEAIMLNDKGFVAEATGDNVFIVKDNVLITPPPSAGILLGVTRGVVMKLAGRGQIKLAEKDIRPHEVHEADECFLTGTAAEVIPVTSVDGKSLGNGQVGPVTRKLMNDFHEFIRSPEAE